MGTLAASGVVYYPIGQDEHFFTSFFDGIYFEGFGSLFISEAPFQPLWCCPLDSSLVMCVLFGTKLVCFELQRGPKLFHHTCQ